MSAALVITDLLFTRELAVIATKPLADQGWQIEYRDWGYTDQATQQAEMLAIERRGPDAAVASAAFEGSSDATILIVGFAPVSQTFLDQLANLELIAINRGGTENISDHAERLGIQILNSSGRNARAVAEYTVGMILAEMRNIARSHSDLCSGIWEGSYANHGQIGELHESVIGLVGLGHVGRLVVEMLGGFRCRFLVFDPYVRELPAECTSVPLDELLKAADVVSIHARLSPETQHLIGSEELSLMKPTAILVNTARAELVNEHALAQALDAGQLAGAALDVFAQEPPDPDSHLVRSTRTTVTPHLAGTTRNAALRGPSILAQRLENQITHCC